MTLERCWPLFALCSLFACNREDLVERPNQALDRPLDVALGCVEIVEDEDALLAHHAWTCATDERTVGEGSTDRAVSCDAPFQPIGFVVNSERNEVAMFRRCGRNGLVDLDAGAPGYQFIPVGELPSRIVATDDACRVVTSNFGSCDLSVIDIEPVASRAYEFEPGVPLSSSVHRLMPTTSTGQRLATSVGDIVAVPREVSLAEATEDDEDAALCTSEATGSVYVTLPECDSVAEVDLRTARVLQSRKFIRRDDGSYEVRDTGTNPQCPQSCADQLSTSDAAARTEVAVVSPMSMALVLHPTAERPRVPLGPNPETEAADEADMVFANQAYDALLVAGAQSDVLFELPLEPTGGFVPASESLQLELENPQGIRTMAVSPPTTMSGGYRTVFQFVYAVAGDGSTHVVSRDFDNPNVLGRECDTQQEGTETLGRDPCPAVAADVTGDPPGRWPLSRGPGIRLDTSAASITDWSFEKRRPLLAGDDPITDNTLYGEYGVVGIGVTSIGTMVATVFDQFEDSAIRRDIDPAGVFNLANGIRPHMLWPNQNPYPEPGSSIDVGLMGLPTVDDDEPGRNLARGAEGTSVLAPHLRQIDMAYTADADTDGSPDDDDQLRAERLGSPSNADALGTFDPDSNDLASYTRAAARVVPRDYRRWPPTNWEIAWEGEIPATTSATGHIVCDHPSPHNGGATCHPPVDGFVPGDACDGDASCPDGQTCAASIARCVTPCSAPDLACPAGLECDEARQYCVLTDEARQKSSRLLDESASFCDAGVLPGDKLTFIGCTQDSECGAGQRCLQAARANPLSGICVAERSIEEDEARLRAACAPFLDDPCGRMTREYLITRAMQTQLWLQPLDIRETSYVRPLDGSAEDDDGEFASLEERVDRFSCALPPGMEQPEGGCETDEACESALGTGWLCIEQLCRRPCELVSQEQGFDACMLRPLPGPLCFRELLNYQVRAHDSFVVRGAGSASFLAQGVIEDVETGECRTNPDASRLMTSRIWLGSDEAETFGHAVLGIRDCPSESPASGDPNPCRVVPIRPDRGADETRPLYHRMRYLGTPVSTIRFSNPWLTFMLDLTSLLDLASPVPDQDDLLWPTTFAQFRRARIPDGYTLGFGGGGGYSAIGGSVLDRIIPGSSDIAPVVYPVRVVKAPESRWFYVVDAGGRGGVSGIRGQVLRVYPTAGGFSASGNFLVR